MCMPAPAADQSPATSAYVHLKKGDYDRAIQLFREALIKEPNRTEWRKELAYALLKAGETEAARDEFGEVVLLDPSDYHAALEYGFLCHETRRTQDARKIFAKLRASPVPEARKAAEEAFRNIDQPLADSIARWQTALGTNPEDFSAHVELARAAELRSDPKLALQHFRRAWQIRPAERGLLIDYGRCARQAGDNEAATAAFLAASRSTQARAAESAREFLPLRYPYAAEFQAAIALDPANLTLRRELGFLLLAVGKTAEAESEFLRLLESAPDDLLALAQVGLLRLARNETDKAMPMLEKVLQSKDPELSKRIRDALEQRRAKPTSEKRDAKKMGDASYAAGYMKDAARYYLSAHESNPSDHDVNLKLGWTLNALQRDEEALRYFELARRSPDQVQRAEASRAFRNLRPALARFRTTTWVLPMFSSRWHEAFSYGQFKTEIRLGKLPLRPYLSLRFVGDSQRAAGTLSPQYLSESSFIAGIGLATRPWRGLVGWAEAGNAIRYRQRHDIGRMTPDYRGGLAFSRLFGKSILAPTPGLFFENSADAVYLSRFRWNLLLYSQNRAGYTLPEIAGVKTQAVWNVNVTTDRKHEAWANFVETGPGLRFRLKRMPSSMVWSLDLLRGRYLIDDGARKPVFYDIRAGIWYAVTR